MKYVKIKFFIIALFLVGMAGCDSATTSFTDGFSENPNNPTNAPAEKVFIAGQVGTVVFLESHSSRKASMWAQYFSGEDRQYASIYSYNLTATDNNSGWILAYVRGLTNLRIAREKYNEREVVPQNQVAATKIFEAMLMGNVTALWGNVPFTQAVNSDETSTPSYDNQAEVYANVISLLDEAITTLGNNSSVAISGDVTTLGGNASKWLKVANTLKARFLMHTGDTAGALAAAQNGIDAVDGSGDMLMPHGEQQGRNQNLYYNYTVVERAGYLRADRSHAREMLANGNNSKTDETTRYNYFFADDENGASVNTEGFAAASESFPLVTYLENQLIIAQVEAGGNDQNAITALNNSREYLNNIFETDSYDDLTASDFQSGVYSNTTLQQHIYNWTYLGLIGQVEGFNFLRRIDYDVDGLEPAQGSEFPQRFIYPQDERNTNSENLPDPTPGTFDPTPVNQ